MTPPPAARTGPWVCGEDAIHISSPAPNPEKQHELDKEMEDLREKLGQSGNLL